MKDAQEVLKALLDGEKIRRNFWAAGSYIYLKDGVVRSRTGAQWNDSFSLRDVGKYEIYKEPQWYDNIPDKGILCWVQQKPYDLKTIRIVYRKLYGKFQTTDCIYWNIAIPLTKEELMEYIYHADRSN